MTNCLGLLFGFALAFGFKVLGFGLGFGAYGFGIWRRVLGLGLLDFA